MYKHLKTKQEYIDRYDKMTVEDCRWRENFHAQYPDTLTEKSEVERKAVRMVGQVAWEIEKVLITLDWYNRKEQTIQKWIDEDERQDRKLENARVPENIFCDQCYSRMQFESRHLWDHDGKERVLFFFDCLKGCTKRKAIYDDGEIYIPEPHLCEKCKSETEIARERLNEDSVQTTYTCPSCGHEEVDVFELSLKKEPEDPKYEYDRARFCLSGDALAHAQESKRNMDNLKHLVDGWKEKEEHKEEYDAVASLQKLTVVSLENILVPLCEKAKFVKFGFGTPDMGKDLIVPFTTHDADPERVDRMSTHALTRIIKKALENTNWRLMSDGISYRMGILTGRLRAYEREEDLLQLAKQMLKK